MKNSKIKKSTFGTRAVVEKSLDGFSLKVRGKAGKKYACIQNEKGAYFLQDAIFNDRPMGISGKKAAGSETYFMRTVKKLQNLLNRKRVVYSFEEYYFALTLLKGEEGEAELFLVVDEFKKEIKLQNFEETVTYMTCKESEDVPEFLEKMLYEYRSRFQKGKILTRQ